MCKVNRNTVKVMPKIYKGHNSKITSTPRNQLTLFNCRVKRECRMDGKCQTMDAVYDCRITAQKKATQNLLSVGRSKIEPKVL